MTETSLQTDHDLLIRIDERLADMEESFRKISNGVGFPRCATHAAKLAELEGDIKEVRNEELPAIRKTVRVENAWSRRLLYGIFVTYIAAEALKGFGII
jgi:hypothetical protein